MWKLRQDHVERQVYLCNGDRSVWSDKQSIQSLWYVERIIHNVVWTIGNSKRNNDRQFFYRRIKILSGQQERSRIKPIHPLRWQLNSDRIWLSASKSPQSVHEPITLQHITVISTVTNWRVTNNKVWICWRKRVWCWGILEAIRGQQIL